MADDIVTRLRNAARACNHGFPNGAGDSFPDPTYCGGCLRLNDAADEIERLRAVVDALTARPFRGTSSERRDRMYGSDWEPVHDALDALEARRG